MLSSETVKKVLEQIVKRPANYDYFFSKLNSADWLEPLAKAGLFTEPPAAIRAGDTISFPFWPESQYLVRIASGAPERVADIMMKIPETNNVRIHADLAYAAVKLPAKLAAKWARKEAAWVEKQEYLYFLLPESLGELIQYLASSGNVHVSLILAKAVLGVKWVGDSPKRPIFRFGVWDLRKILQKNFLEVVRHSRQEGLILLCDILDDTLVEEFESDEDYSLIWRPAIELHVQNHGNRDRDTLIDAIRDGSIEMIKNGYAVHSVLQVLFKYSRPIFKRLAFHLLTESHERQAARELVCNRENFFNIKLWHEFSRLLASVYSELDQKDKDLILSWIEEGPIVKGSHDQLEPELWRKHKVHWQAQKLFGLRGKLPEEWEDHYTKIVSEFGEIEHPDLMTYMSTSCGPKSPKTDHELDAMSTVEVAFFLKSWEPSHAWDSPEPEGLGRVLQAIVTKAPNRFVSDLDTFRDIDSTYATALLQGLNDAVKAGHIVEWGAVLEYLLWVAKQPRPEVMDISERRDQPSNWSWARKMVVSLLSLGLEKNSIDVSLRNRVWEIIDMIADDPEPSIQDDEHSSIDPHNQSINTPRGEALHSVIKYALWVYSKFEGEEEPLKSEGFNMTMIPEVRGCLERHLDPSFDPSPAIRSVFGQWFPQLLLLDASWGESKIDTIFPVDNTVLRDAAWHTYLAFCSACSAHFRVLREQYNASVDRLKLHNDDKSKRFERSGERLGEHLMVMLGRGIITWDDDDALVKRFFDHATESETSHAVAFVGQSLYNDIKPISVDVVERFRGLWEQLAKIVPDTPSNKTERLKQFGWWFASECFDVEWAFKQLITVLESTGEIEPDYLVMERLADLAAKYPARCLEVLYTLVNRNEQGWIFLGSEESARTVLHAALETEETKTDARTLIHKLGARSHFQFREMLQSQEK
jgi:hypothetical protein